MSVWWKEGLRCKGTYLEVSENALVLSTRERIDYELGEVDLVHNAKNTEASGEAEGDKSAV